jgi:hypothetical protein
MTLPVAGWYDDPADAEQLRWWTGTAWSDARAQREAEAAVAPPVAPPVPAPPVLPPIPVPDAPLFAESSAPLPYGPAAVTGATVTPPTGSSPTAPPELPPFARPTAAATDVPAVPSVPALQAAPAAPAGPAPLSSFAQLRKANPLAFTGVLVGLLALLFNPLGGPGLLTLILGMMGLLRANDLKRRGAAITGLTWAIVALVLGGIAAVRVVAKVIGMSA